MTTGSYLTDLMLIGGLVAALGVVLFVIEHLAIAGLWIYQKIRRMK